MNHPIRQARAAVPAHEQGASTIEYSLLIALCSIALILLLSGAVDPTLLGAFDGLAERVLNCVSPGGTCS